MADAGRRDELESATSYDLLEQVVAPLFYETGADGLPHRWLEMVAHTFAGSAPRAQAARMVREYVETLYVPAARVPCARRRPRPGPVRRGPGPGGLEAPGQGGLGRRQDRAHRGG